MLWNFAGLALVFRGLEVAVELDWPFPRPLDLGVRSVPLGIVAVLAGLRLMDRD